MPHGVSRLLGSAFVLALVAWVGGAALWGALFALRTATEGDRFDFVRWEAQSLPNRPLFLLGAPFRRDPPPEQALGRYFALGDRTGSEAHAIENHAEAAIESRVSAVLREQGIGWPFPGVFPPVDIELASSPRILVESPRARIERVADEPLRPDLTRAQAQAIEASVERDRARSALVVPSGGVATYPAIVSYDGDYEDLVSSAAHEWMHHYFAAYPLGQSYFANDDARTINETVADVAGELVARLVVERWGTPQPAAPRPAPGPAAQVDVTRALRDLRVEVDRLLAAGEVEPAERRMAEVRDELASRGVNIRRINQAYFAWYGTYAARPESVDPLGGQVRAILERAGSLRRFVEQVRDLQTRADVARLAAE